MAVPPLTGGDPGVHPMVRAPVVSAASRDDPGAPIYATELGQVRLASAGGHAGSAGPLLCAPSVRGESGQHGLALSADGSLLAFASDADDLLPGDHNRSADIFLADLETGTSVLISASLYGGSGNGASHHPTLSADGRVIAFVSAASDLVPGDDNQATDLFVHDLRQGLTTRIEIGAGTGLVSAGMGLHPSLSLARDGNTLAYVSLAGDPDSHSATADAAAPRERVFVTDLTTGTTRMVSVDNDGAPLPEACFDVSLSHDGRMVAFSTTLAPPYQDVVIHDLRLERSEMLHMGTRARAPGDLTLPRLAGNGTSLALVSTVNLDRPGAHEGADVLLVPLRP